MLLERSIPFGLGGLLLVIVLFYAVVRNPNVPYFLRFNALQALLTDIALIVLSIGFRLLLQPIAAGSLLVEARDDAGKPIQTPALPNLRLLDKVKVTGKLTKDDFGNLVLLASGMFRSDRPLAPDYVKWPE